MCNVVLSSITITHTLYVFKDIIKGLAIMVIQEQYLDNALTNFK